MQNINIIKCNNFKLGWILIFLTVFIGSCDYEFELPEEGSIADETPPSAAFDFSQNEADFLQIDFVNLSESATDYIWDFGDGNSSTEKEPSNTYAAEGTYTVILTASDKLNVSNEMSQEIVINKPVVNFTPVILEASFEDNTLPDGTGDGRDSWRNDAGGVIQITESPVFDGSQAAKLPSEGDRVGMQLIAVLPNTDYMLKFNYTMKSDPGILTVAILNAKVGSMEEVADATIAAAELTDNSDASTYVAETLSFNSGDNTEVAIYFNNSGSECRIDNFEIE